MRRADGRHEGRLKRRVRRRLDFTIALLSLYRPEKLQHPTTAYIWDDVEVVLTLFDRLFTFSVPEFDSEAEAARGASGPTRYGTLWKAVESVPTICIRLSSRGPAHVVPRRGCR